MLPSPLCKQLSIGAGLAVAGLLCSGALRAQVLGWSSLVISSQSAGANVRPVHCAAAADGTALISGWYTQAPQFGKLAPLPSAQSAGFVAKLDARTGQWLWSASILPGTGGHDSSIKSAVFTAAGDVIVAGYCTQGNVFGSLPSVDGGGREAFVAKLSGSTGQWLWASTTSGFGINNDEASSLALTPVGDPVITGTFSGTTSFGSISLVPGGTGNNSFVAKVDGATGQWQWVTPLTGAVSRAVAATPSGDVLTAGSFAGTVQFGAVQALVSGGTEDTYVAKLSGSGGQWQWATRAGSANPTRPLSLAATAAGEAFVAGYYSQAAQFGSLPTLTVPGSGPQAVFVAKINGAGQWQWSAQAHEQYYGPEPTVVSTATGDALVAGTFTGNALFGSLPALSSAGSEDVFVAKLAGDTGQWQWATRAGGPGRDYGYGLALTPAGEPVVAGICGAAASFGTLTGNGAGAYVALLGSTVTSAPQQAYATHLQVFPNPAATHFTVRLPPLMGSAAQRPIPTRLVNSLGQVVQRQLLPAASNGAEAHYDVRNLPAGIYTLQLLIGNEQITRRLAVQ